MNMTQDRNCFYMFKNELTDKKNQVGKKPLSEIKPMLTLIGHKPFYIARIIVSFYNHILLMTLGLISKF